MNKVLLSLTLVFSCVSFASDFNVLTCIDNLNGEPSAMYNLDLRYNTLEVRTSFFGSADLSLENCSLEVENGSVVCNGELAISDLINNGNHYVGMAKDLPGFSSRDIYCSTVND